MEQITKFYVKLATLLAPLKDRKGQGLVEYALLLALIAIVVIAAVTMIGGKACNVYSKISGSL